MTEFFDIEELSAQAPRAEQSFVELLEDGARLLKYGIINRSKPELNEVSNIMLENGRQILVDTARLGATFFDISSDAVSDVVELVESSVTGPHDRTPAFRSILGGCLVLGFYDAKKTELAADIFDKTVTHSGVQNDVFVSLLKKDPNIT